MSSREELLRQAQQGIRQILQLQSNGSLAPEQAKESILRVMSVFDRSQVMVSNKYQTDGIPIVQAIQKACVTISGSSRSCLEASSWCERQWMHVLQMDAQNVAALKGLGYYWLARSKHLLTRVYELEAAVPYNGSRNNNGSDWRNTRSITSRALNAANNEETMSQRLEQLRHRPEYVEARSLLVAATGFFARAIAAIPSHDPGYGPLLVETGQAYIHLAVVQPHGASLDSFLKASRVLQRAAQIPGLGMPDHLREYLAEYGRYT